MSHSYDVTDSSSTTAGTQSAVSSLASVPSGDIHMLVTFEILAEGQPRAGGTVDATFILPDTDGELTDERQETDGSGGPEDDGPGEFDAVAASEQFDESVRQADASTQERLEAEFGDSVDVDSLVSYLGLDFVEHELFADRFLADSADVVYTSRGLGPYQLLCVYATDRGLLLVVDDDEAIQPLVGRARSLLTEA